MNPFLTSFLAILASELGDRTFIVTTILAMKHSRVSVFAGAITAAALMITVSGIIGLSSSFIPQSLVHFLSVSLFFCFGIQMLYEGFHMDASKEEQEDLSSVSPSSLSGGSFSAVFASTFMMNFLAEWGDKSQLSVIILAAKSSFGLVCAGALAGHLVTNALAVVGGSAIRDLISIRTVTLVGGVTFLSFAALAVSS